MLRDNHTCSEIQSVKRERDKKVGDKTERERDRQTDRQTDRQRRDYFITQGERFKHKSAFLQLCPCPRERERERETEICMY